MSRRYWYTQNTHKKYRQSEKPFGLVAQLVAQLTLNQFSIYFEEKKYKQINTFWYIETNIELYKTHN